MWVSINQIGRALAIVALLGGLAVAGDWLLATHFMVYDDEGYVLWSLRHYTAEGGLYTRVYSQYGPFFYLAYDALHRVTGWAFTNDNARWITLGFWLAASGFAGAAAAELTRNWLARAAATLLTFAALSVMSSEPGHPGGSLALLSALGAWWGVRTLGREDARGFVIGAALIGAAMLLIKINVGLFFLIAAASWIALHTRNVPARAIEWLVLLGCVVSPLLLMRAQLGVPGFAQFGLVFAAGATALVLALRRAPRDPLHAPGDGVWFVAVAAGTAAAIAALVVARGTSWRDLIHGVVIAPLNQPMAYAFPPRWQPAASVLALAGLGLAALLCARRDWSPAIRRGVAGARLLALAAGAWWARDAIEHTTGAFFFHYGVALAWLFAVPLQPTATPLQRARLWLAWVFVWQTLHAFPVAGSQIGWGSLLGAALFAVGSWEAVEELAGGGRRRRWALHAVVLALATLPAGSLARTGWLYRQHSTPLALPGAKRLRLPLHLALTARALVRNVHLHGATLFSHPGMFSFNLWSGHPTPTAANVTVWSTLLSDAQQDAIREKLAADPRAVVIGQQYVLTHLIERGFAPRGPLNAYLVENFAPAFRLDTYVFWTKRGRAIAPVGTAKRTGESEIELITDRPARLARWEIWSYGGPRIVVAGEIPVTVRNEAIQPDGTPSADRALRRITWPIPASALPRAEDIALRVLDAEGREIEFVPFRN